MMFDHVIRMHAQEKELEHLTKSLAALSGEPCSTDRGQSRPHNSSQVRRGQAPQPGQGPWQAAQGPERSHPQTSSRVQDLWPDDDALPDNFDSAVQQQGGAQNSKAASGRQARKDQPSTMSDQRRHSSLPQTALPNELHLESSSSQQRPAPNPSGARPQTPQHQPYTVTEPDSPKSLSTIPQAGGQRSSYAQPIVITETTVTRSGPHV